MFGRRKKPEGVPAQNAEGIIHTEVLKVDHKYESHNHYSVDLQAPGRWGRKVATIYLDKAGFEAISVGQEVTLTMAFVPTLATS